MKNKSFRIAFFYVLIFSILTTTSSCSERNETVNCFPNVSVSVIVNLNLPAYFNLQTVGGWIYLDEQSSGTRGLIVVRTTTGFKIYDRNAPHICPSSDTTLNVVNNIKIVCSKDNAEWILLTGQPTAVANIPPKTYPYSYNQNSNILTIYN